MADLWKKLIKVPGYVEQPVDYEWQNLPLFFTQKANGSFCQDAD